MTPARCSCGLPAVRSLAATVMCQRCFDGEIARILMTHRPWGRYLVPADGWPVDYGLLECVSCSATWVGHAGDACAWCAARDAARDDDMGRPVEVGHDRARPVWCSVHQRVWLGRPGEVHGVHDPDDFWSCNERAVALPRGWE